MASSNPLIPCVRDGKLYDHAGQVICQVSSADRAAWLAWLETARSFAFVASNGAHCTVIKERRRSSSGAIHHYWYAYRSIRNQKRRLSLGKSERLDLARLSEAATRLAQAALPFERGPFALARRAALVGSKTKKPPYLAAEDLGPGLGRSNVSSSFSSIR